MSDTAQIETAPSTAYLGVLTQPFYSDVANELSALTASAGVFDRSYRARVRITGSDRVRWLNGMVTNTVKALTPGVHNYTFVLNAQGRIQGDLQVYALPDVLIFETDRSQLAHLLAHFERFIIMDDVELAELPGTTLGLAGPGVASLLHTPELHTPEPGRFSDITLAGVDATLVNLTLDPAYPRYDLWLPDDSANTVWAHLLAAGSTPCGVQAVEALRLLEGVPLYGVDIHDKTLAQETGQARALNFSKGCYLGQEIVERIRSRATVHRSVSQFALAGEQPLPGAALTADGAPAGELTSIAAVDLPYFSGMVALGTARNEILERARALTYAGGTARALTMPPRP